jgi:hypothetical protein
MTLPRLYPPSRRFATVVRWLGLALLGIVVAAVVAIAASRLASQQIGLASEPVSAGDALAPAAEWKAGRKEHRHAHAHRHRARKEAMPGKGQAGTTSAPPSTTTPTTNPATSTPEAQPAAPSQPAGPADGEEVEQSGPDD